MGDRTSNTESTTIRSSNVLRYALVALAATCAAAPTLAVEASWSGFGTIGYAESNSKYTYQRYIDDDGTWRRDTVLAGQLDLRFNPQWSATLQVKASPADNDDTRWRAEPAWAFVAWRPNNDWLVRAGKFRAPMYLYSESLDVGVSHDMVRLPHEVYSIAPTNDFGGLFVTRSFTRGAYDISLDGYAGRSHAIVRMWNRDGIAGQFEPGAQFTAVNGKVAGLILTARSPDVTWRAGASFANIRLADGRQLPVRFPWVELAPGLGYWQVNDQMPGPGVPSVNSYNNLLLAAGVDWQMGDGWRLSSELASMRQYRTEVGFELVAGYVALFKRIDKFTPYVSVAKQKSSAEVLGWAQRLRTPTLPPQVPGAAQINGAQRLAGEFSFAYDQESIALGLSYALSPTLKLKGEWMHTRVGRLSNHFDTPAGKPDSGGLRVNSLSVNLSFAF